MAAHLIGGATSIKPAAPTAFDIGATKQQSHRHALCRVRLNRERRDESSVLWFVALPAAPSIAPGGPSPATTPYGRGRRHPVQVCAGLCRCGVAVLGGA